MTKRLKDTPGLSDFVRKSDSFKSDKLIKVFDTKTNKHIFKNVEEVADNIDRFRPIETERISEKDIERAKRIMAMDRSFNKGGRVGYKSGTRGCKLAKRGKGRAYGKNS